MKKEMLINVLQPEECRIAIVEDGALEELYVERASQESYVNNIYKGRIVNIEPSIQAAFVDFGIGRNGFLHVSDVDPVYYKHIDMRGGGRDRDRGDRGERGDRGRRGGSSDRGRRPSSFTPVVIPAADAVPPEFEEEATPPQEMVGWLEPPVPADDDAPEPIDDGFGGDLLDDLTPEGPAANDVVEAPPEAEAEARPKRGGRGRGRRKPEGEDSGDSRARRRSPKKKPDAEAPADGAPESDKPDDDKPRVMGSAEHRTTGEEPEIEPGHEGGFVFDPHAPNDRFHGKPSKRPAKPVADEEMIEEAETPDEEDVAEVESDIEPVDMEEVGPAAELVDENPAADAAEYAEDEEDEDEEDDLDEDFPSGRGRGGRGRERGGPRGRGGPRRSFGRDGGRPKPPIQEIFKRGQEVIVQVIKEGIGTKGPTLSTYISIAGRYLVLMPSLNRIAVSRKIMDEDVRIRLKESLTQLNPPKGIGFIIRTAAIDRNKAELRNDLSYLVRLWEVFSSRVLKRPAPVEIYRESDMITRTIRDIFTADIDSIYVDEANAYTQAAEFLKIVMPRYADRIKHYADTEPIFTRFKIEPEIARINEKKIPLALGGSIVIEQTEALVAIDVNSGNFRADNNAEETAYQMNLQAAKEIGRQLRLRDLGGVIVNDFIDMKDERHRRNVEQALRNALRRDRARTKILKTSAFGVIEMTRQRIRPSLKRSIYQDCPHCRATGNVKTSESMSIEIMRLFQLAAHRKTIRNLQAKVHADVAQYLLNKKRKEILHWEELGQMQVTISGSLGVSPEFLELQGFDNNGNEVKVVPVEPVRVAPERRPHDDRGDRGGRNDRGRRGGGRGGRDRERERD
jgi:ribonuclease E